METLTSAPRSSSSFKSLQNLRVVKADEPTTGPRAVLPPEKVAASGEHYRAYRPQPFAREERSHVTVLFGGLHWRAERAIQGAMENLGYRVQVLPTASREDLLTGREVADIGQCCPTSFTTGNLANFLRDQARRTSPEEVNRNFVYVTAGACGACRFGQYHQSYELALRNVGLEAFRMFLLEQQKFDQGAKEGGGLELSLPFNLGVVWSIILTDVLQDFEYRTRPFEKVPGATDRAVRDAVELLYQAFRRRPNRGRKWDSAVWHLATGYFVRAMREVRALFDAVEVDRTRVKPVVKITGEFYLQTVEGEPNHNIHRWLEGEGAEVYPAAVTVWLDYLLRHAAQNFEDRIGIKRGARLHKALVHVGHGLLRWTYNRMRGALADVPHELPDQYELRRLAAPYYYSRLSGGEGDMLVGKALWAHLGKKAHMTCELSPYACMPNTMSIGAMAAVLGKHPDLLYAPIEIKGDAEVHALSRCQMILTEARKRAQREFEQTLEATRLSADDLQQALAEHPQWARATWRLPHRGVAGTAANFALHVAAARRA